MKFGRFFHRYQLPEWAPFYVNYNAFKARIKAACLSAHEQRTSVDFTGKLLEIW